jgi:DNA-directed RNA polymerase delta subunit
MTKIPEDLLNLFESLLRSQLNTIKQLRKTSNKPEEEAVKEKRMSHMDMTYNILLSAQKPMHINEIIPAIHQRFGLKIDKESLVSALAKRVLRQDRFVKTAPNTFALISLESRGNQP